MLLDAVNGAMIARYHVHRLPSPGEDWVVFTRANARSMRKTLLTVRDGARLAAGTRPDPTDFVDAERVLRLYVDAGFSAEEALNISISIARYVVGYVLEEQGERERAEEDAGAESNIEAELAPYPLMREAFASLVDRGTINTESAFETGLGYFIEGMRAALEEKGRA